MESRLLPAQKGLRTPKAPQDAQDVQKGLYHVIGVGLRPYITPNLIHISGIVWSKKNQSMPPVLGSSAVPMRKVCGSGTPHPLSLPYVMPLERQTDNSRVLPKGAQMLQGRKQMEFMGS